MSTSAVILAAGKSTRMKSRLPKVLHEVCGKPMLQYVLNACYDAGCERAMVIVGHAKEEVMAAFSNDPRIDWVEQKEQLGTGHAVQQCIPHLKRTQGDVFILAGDGPLIRGDVLKALLEAHKTQKAAASMATAILPDPYGYGRVIRDGAGEFVEIIEEADATPEQRKIQEVFPSYYCVRSEDLLAALSRLTNNNKKGEYYLTDIYGILRSAGKKVTAVQAVTEDDVLSVNTRQQQANVDAVMQGRIHAKLREDGVTIVNSANTYIESGVSIGTETIIRPFSYVGRDARIGRDCHIGPFAAVARGSVVADGANVAGVQGR
jgi:bifunctional UDP-N-acetylglucosamine pyrophosphorylase/glucosamine-1-phosphate N-acetyltransferase